MAALIPALIKMFMSRARGGGGGGGGMPKPEKSAADRDNEYWEKQGMSTSDSADALSAALKNRSQPMTWAEAQQSFNKTGR